MCDNTEHKMITNILNMLIIQYANTNIYISILWISCIKRKKLLQLVLSHISFVYEYVYNNLELIESCEDSITILKKELQSHLASEFRKY